VAAFPLPSEEFLRDEVSVGIDTHRAFLPSCGAFLVSRA
jgi:hypothetical protein